MSDTGYNDDDPWHSSLNLFFGLMCDRCQREVTIDWSQVHDGGDDDLLRQCVAVSDHARNEGWKHGGGSHFLCPSCSGAGNG